MAQRVLIVQLGSLRALIATLPLVADVQRALPGSHIDWLVEAEYADALRHSVGSTRSVGFEFARWCASQGSAAAKQLLAQLHDALQQWPEGEHPGYDAVLVCDSGLTTGLVAAHAPLAPQGQRYTLEASATQPASGNAFARVAARVRGVIARAATSAVGGKRIQVAVDGDTPDQAARRLRQFSAQALGYVLPEPLHFALLHPYQKKRSTLKTLALVVADASGSGSAQAPAWDAATWAALGKRLRGLGYRFALPHASDAQRIAAKRIARHLGEPTHVWPDMPLAMMPEALAGCWGAIGFDSAMMDLSRAIDLPCVHIKPDDSVDAVFSRWIAVAR